MLYLAPKVSDYRKSVEGYILFLAEPSTVEKTRIEKCIPYPINTNVKWHSNILIIASDDLFSLRVLRQYGSFFRRMKAILFGINQRAAVTELELFFTTLKENLTIINSISPVCALLLPVCDFDELLFTEEFFEEGRYTFMSQIKAELLPVLLAGTQSKNNEKNMLLLDFLYVLFEYIPKTNLDEDSARILTDILRQTYGIHEYYDKINSDYLKKLADIAVTKKAI